MKQKEKSKHAPEEEKPDAEVSRGHIIERPDGFYVQAADSGGESGPFATRAEAEAGMLSGVEDAPDPEALHEAESELGISEWIDPDSGMPAEDSVPRIEDH